MTETTPPTAETPVKRGRGRPVGWRGTYKPRKKLNPAPELNPSELKEAQAKKPMGRPPKKPRTRRLANGQFGKGASGNPAGSGPLRAKIFSNLAVAAREFGGLALDRLVYLVTNGDTHSIQLGASLALLDRGYGRPTQTLDLKADIQSTNVSVFANLTPNGQRVMAETLKAIQHSPAALELAVEIMQDDGPIDEIPDDILDLEPAA
jgi:hypothetical protein